MYKRWCCLTLEQSHLPNNFWSYEPVATKEAGEPGRGRCSYCSPSKWRLSYVVRQLRTYSEFISSVAQKISSAIGKLLWSSCFPIKSFFFIINLFGCWPLHLECCRKGYIYVVNMKSILWCWRLVSGRGWHPCDTAFPLLCPQNGGVIAKPSRDDSWSVQRFTPATVPCSFPGTKTIQVSVLTLQTEWALSDQWSSLCCGSL